MEDGHYSLQYIYLQCVTHGRHIRSYGFTDGSQAEQTKIIIFHFIVNNFTQIMRNLHIH